MLVSFFKFDILVRPSTILETLVPKSFFILLKEYFVSSITSCKSAAEIETASRPI